MSKDKLKSSSGADPSLQETFNKAAASLDLELTEPSVEANRSVGVLIVPVCAAPVVEVSSPSVSTDYGSSDEQAIRELVQAWETVQPEGVAELWQERATDPALGVGPDWIGSFRLEDMKRGLDSEAFKNQMLEYPLHDPRKTAIKNLVISFLGATSAVVTYRLEEEYANGKLFAGNSLMVVFKEDSDRWRVSIFTKRAFHQTWREVE